MSKIFIEKARGYAKYHTETVTKITHFVGIPLIVFSLMILCSFIKISVPLYFEPTSLSWFLMIATVVYYCRLNWKLGICTAPLLILFNYLADLIAYSGPTKGAVEVFFLLFVFGWIAQLAGHFYEKKRPAFLDNFAHVFIAPLFLVAEAFFYFGMMNDLYMEIYNLSAEEIEKMNQERIKANTEENFEEKGIGQDDGKA